MCTETATDCVPAGSRRTTPEGTGTPKGSRTWAAGAVSRLEDPTSRRAVAASTPETPATNDNIVFPVPSKRGTANVDSKPWTSRFDTIPSMAV